MKGAWADQKNGMDKMKPLKISSISSSSRLRSLKEHIEMYQFTRISCNGAKMLKCLKKIKSAKIVLISCLPAVPLQLNFDETDSAGVENNTREEFICGITRGGLIKPSDATPFIFSVLMHI